MEPEHVHDSNSTDHSSIQIWSLVSTGSYQHPTMATSVNCKFLLDSVLLFNKELRSTLEVRETVLQLPLPPSVRPPLSILPASPHVGNRHDSKVLDEEIMDGAVVGSETDTEASIAIEKTGGTGVRDKVFPHSNEHRDLGSILTGIEHLLHLVI